MSRNISDAPATPDRDRRRRRGERARAARTHRRRERRGLRERLLGGGVAPEPAAARAAAAARRRERRGVATVGALLVDLRNYQPFLFLLGSFFVPLFGVLLADWLLAGCHYAPRDVFAAPALRLVAARRLARRLLSLPVALSGRPGVVDADSSRTPHPHALPWGGASLPSFAAAFVLTSAAWAPRAPAGPRAARDRAPRQPARGTSCRATRRGSAAGRSTGRGRSRISTCRHSIYARCAQSDRDELLPPLVALGTPVRVRGGRAHGDLRVLVRGRPARDGPSARSATSGCPKTSRGCPKRCGWSTSRRSRAPTSRRDARGDGRPRAAALVRRPGARPAVADSAPLELDADFDPELLRHVAVLKLNDEEAEVIGDPTELGVRELLLTHGSRGATVVADGSVHEVPRVRARGRPDRRRRRASASRTSSGALSGARAAERCAPRDLRSSQRCWRMPGDRARRDRCRHLRRRSRDRRGRAGRSVRARLRRRVSTCRGWWRLLRPDRPWSRSSMRGRRCSSPTTRARPGASPAAASRRARRSRSRSENPDVLVYAARNRLYVSRNGGVFWTALDAELPEIDAVALRES